MKFQNVENTGIRKESSLRYGVDKSSSVRSFEPGRLIEYLQTLSEFPSGGIDRLELVIAKAQLRAFYRFKGYHCLPELQNCGGLSDNETYTLFDGASPMCKNGDQTFTSPENSKRQSSSSHKPKRNLKEGVYPTKKERSLTELMDGIPDSPDSDGWSDGRTFVSLLSSSSGKKRKAAENCANHLVTNGGRKTISFAKVSNTAHLPKKSFRIGECISRVASQLTGSPSVLNYCKDRSQKLDGSYDELDVEASNVSLHISDETRKESLTIPTEYSSLTDLLSLLQLAAQEPLNDYSSLNFVVSFFSDFRNSIILGNSDEREVTFMEKVGNKRKRPTIAGSPETFEFEDMSDTYWKDRVIKNGSEEQPSRRNRRREYQLALAEPEKPLQVSRRSYSRKRYSEDNNAEAADKPAGYIDENSPAELTMNFAELNSVPSETNLNKMFRRFGPLREFETEVDRESSRARVVFKKCSDAEIAFSSAKKFNIFGRTLVNYHLNYTPSALFKASSVTTAQEQEMHLDLSTLHAPWTSTSPYSYPQPITEEQDSGAHEIGQSSQG
ncbi:Serine/threonine protein kinase ATM [Quillaja saponaria]|uniref:Serine/threonine protein kinase ATM n=1 Tax=Quillaja saponaria TaxID=32244 RepID=A0AAD7P5G7_QUISA|nr:Serine/threonine protein kinase ATM [Quillaja saponaria]